MNKFLYLLFLSAFFLDYLAHKLDLISGYIAWLPDILSMIAVVLVVILSTTKGNAVAGKYVVLFACLIAVIIIGLATNTASPGTLIVGARNYLKYLPFFFLPAVYSFTEKQVAGQTKLLLALALLQGPLGIFQKFVQFGIRSSGDHISGTLTSGGQLPILLSASIAMITAFYLRGRMSTTRYVIFLGLLFIPITLAESKAALGFIPLAFMVPIYVNLRSGQGGRAAGKRIAALLLVFAVTGVSFVVVYDYFAQFGRENRREGLVAFFASGDAARYLNRGAVSARRVEKAGYVDIILLPLVQLSDDPFKLFFGLGIGSVSATALEGLADADVSYDQYDIVLSSATSRFLWETGIFGALIHFVFFYMLYKDSRRLSRNDGLMGRIALGWSGVVAVGTLSLLAKDIFVDSANAYPFWYLSGLVAAGVIRMDRTAKSQRNAAAALSVQ